MENEIIKNNMFRVILAIIVGAMVITLAILMSIIFEFGIVGNLVTSWILTTAYALFAFFLIDPKVIFNPVKFVDRPVIQEVIREIPVEVEKIVEIEKIVHIQIPMENKTIEVIDRPVIQEVIRYVEKEHKQVNIPKFEFIGSTQTETYHKRTCKFSKMLKNKYKLHSNSKTFFKRKHYHACKACITSK